MINKMNKSMIKSLLELVFSTVWLIIVVVGLFILFT